MKRVALVCGLIMGILVAPVAAKDTINSTVASVWQNLPTSGSQCPDFDYFPDGGMQNFWCHISKDMPLSLLEEATGQKIFLSGPHGATLNLKDKTKFGQYNPKFVEALTKLVVPSEDDTTFIAQTQSVYNSHVRPLARFHFLTLQKLQKNPACAKKETLQYKSNIEKAADEQQEWYNERWFYFMNPKFCTTDNIDALFDDGFDGGHDGNVVKTATGFWLRRSMDGTQPLFVGALEALLTRYDSEWLTKQRSQ